MSYTKIYKDYYNCSIPKGWQVHHIDWDCKNNDPLNLICIPRKLHSLIHHHLGYIKRDDIDKCLSAFLKIKNIDNYSKNALVFKLSKHINIDTSKRAAECFDNQNRGMVNHSYHKVYKGGHSYFI